MRPPNLYREVGGLRQFHSLSVFPALIVEHIEIEPGVCIAESYALESLNSDRSVPSCRLVTESQQTCVYLLECFVNYAVAVSSAVRKLDIASEYQAQRVKTVCDPDGISGAA